MSNPWHLLVASIVGYLLYETEYGRKVPHSVLRQFGPVVITGPHDHPVLLEPDGWVLVA